MAARKLRVRFVVYGYADVFKKNHREHREHRGGKEKQIPFPLCALCVLCGFFILYLGLIETLWSIH